MYLTLIILPLIGSIVAGFFGRKVGVVGTQIVTCGCIIITTILSIMVFLEAGMNNTPVTIRLFNWIDSEYLNIFWSFNFDSLTISMLLPVLIISSLVHIYSIGYMSHDPHNQRFFSYLSLFTFMMIILVTADNFLLMFVGWEGVGVCSYLLVSFWFTRIAANQSSLAAFFTNRVGDCLLTIGLFIILLTFGNIDYHTVFTLAPYINENIITIIGICLLIGAMAKSVRWSAIFWNGDKISKHWSIMFLTTKLGIKGNFMPNIASSYNNSENYYLVNIPKVKAILPEVYLSNVLYYSQRLQYLLNVYNLYLVLLDTNMTYLQLNCINNFKIESGQPKGIVIQKIGSSGLPKIINSYGNRGIIVPVINVLLDNINNVYDSSNVEWKGSIPDLKLLYKNVMSSNYSNNILPISSKNNASKSLNLKKSFINLYPANSGYKHKLLQISKLKSDFFRSVWFIKISFSKINFNDKKILFYMLENVIKDETLSNIFKKAITQGCCKKENITLNFVFNNLISMELDKYITNIKNDYCNSINVVCVRYENEILLGLNTSKKISFVFLNKIKTFLATQFCLEINYHIYNNKKSFYFLDFSVSNNLSTNLDNKLKIDILRFKVIKKLHELDFLKNNKPIPKFTWLHSDKDMIVYMYNYTYNLLLSYYSYGNNYNDYSRLIYYSLKTSCIKLLAAKYSLRTKKNVIKQFGNNLKGKDVIEFVKYNNISK
jgi:hypothetical protein